MATKSKGNGKVKVEPKGSALYEVLKGIDFERRELVGATGAAHDRFEVEQRETVLRVGRERVAIELGQLGIGTLIALGEAGGVHDHRRSIALGLGGNLLELLTAKPQQLADLIGRGVLALETMQEIDPARVRLRRTLERDLRGSRVGAELHIDVREQLVGIGLAGIVTGGLGGLQLIERERGQWAGLADLIREPDQRQRCEWIARAELQCALI